MSYALVCLAIFVLLCVAVHREARGRPSSKADWERAEREAGLRYRQVQARKRMSKLGIKTLLDGHKGWAKVNPMAKAATVIPMRKQR